MRIDRPKRAQNAPLINPKLVVLFGSAALLAAVLYTDLSDQTALSPRQIRQDARRDVRALLDVLRHE